MILDLDIGNSSISWLLSHGKQERLGSCRHDTAELARAVEAAAADLPVGTKVQQLRVACVMQDEQLRDEMLKQISEHWRLKPLIAAVKRQHAGLTTNYDSPSQLGVDRWLAILALARRGTAASWLVIDAGTAITLDVLAASVHLGGVIIPGRSLMMDAFYRRTKLPPPPAPPPAPQTAPQTAQKWGTNTNSCLTLGSDAAVEQGLKYFIDNFYLAYPDGRVVLSGGAGAELQQTLAAHYNERAITYTSHLVCRGLAVCFKP